MNHTQTCRSSRTARVVAPLLALGLLAAGGGSPSAAVADSSWTRITPKPAATTLADSSWTRLPVRPAGKPIAPLDSLWD